MYDVKEEAEKCIEIAEKSMQSGNREKAIRFLEKAQRFYPTDRARELLEKWKNMPSDNEDCFKEHVDAVKRVKRCKNYYEVLGVSNGAVDSDIKKAYKKLALQLHPDKNKTPGAAEAFKEIGNAVAVLTDPEKRKQYDLYLTEGDRPGSFTPHRTGEHFRGFEADITPEELFNIFFSSFPNPQTVYGRRNGRWSREETPHAARQQNGAILNIIPIVIVLFLSLLSSFFVTDPIYSLHESTKFPVARKTQNLKVPYFVKQDFPNEYQGSLRRLELTVEEDYVNNLKKACYKEKSYRESLMWKARNFDNKELLRKAHQQPMPSCEALNQIHHG